MYPQHTLLQSACRGTVHHPQQGTEGDQLPHVSAVGACIWLPDQAKIVVVQVSEVLVQVAVARSKPSHSCFCIIRSMEINFCAPGIPLRKPPHPQQQHPYHIATKASCGCAQVIFAYLETVKLSSVYFSPETRGDEELFLSESGRVNEGRVERFTW